MHTRTKTAAALAALVLATGSQAQVTLHADADLQGRSMTATQAVGNFDRAGFNDRASSVTLLGSGRDLATAGGVVTGAGVGAHLGRGEPPAAQTREVQRCSGNAAAARPGHWDVGYRFRGQDHQVQMTTAPGSTVSVNRRGEPRI